MSIIKKLADANVFIIDEFNEFVRFTDNCDVYYSTDLSASELGELAYEILAMKERLNGKINKDKLK